jgi:hypothetical protein
VSLWHITLLLLAGVSVVAPARASARPADVRIQEEYEWPGRAVIQWSVSQGDLLVVSRSEQPAAAVACGMGAPVLGVSLPWFRYGPLLGRGMLRQVFDPLASSAGSGLLKEPTGLVLDGALPPSRAGTLLVLPTGHGGLFCRPGREGGTEYGAYGRLPIRGGAAAECVILAARPDPRSAADEWYPDKSPFPGGDITNFAARLMLDSSPLSFSYSAGASSAQFAASGAFSTLWLRGQVSEIEAAVFAAGATSGYRAPDGSCASAASRLSGFVRLGRDRSRGTLEAGISRDAAEPGFSPRPEIPTRNVVRAALWREYAGSSSLRLALLLEAEKAVNRDHDGARTETARCGSTACLSLGTLEVTTALGVSDNEGADARGTLTLRPSARLRIVAEGRGDHLGTSGPAASMCVKMSVENGDQRAAVRAGIEDYPLAGRCPSPAKVLASHLRLSLSCSVICR